MTDSEQIWVLDWQNLNDLEVMDRVAWLRESLEAGKDWAVCNDPRICVLKTSSASMLYRMRWFDDSTKGLSALDIEMRLKPYLDKKQPDVSGEIGR